jgi:hypothetical protein
MLRIDSMGCGMCRLLIYNPAATHSWRECLPPHLAKLGQVEREWEELAQGIRWDEAEETALMKVGEYQAAHLCLGTVPNINDWTAPEDTPQLWQALSQVADYGRLVLVREDSGLSLYLYQPDAEGNGDYLYHPHPGRVVSGRFAEVFAPTNPAATICACTLGDEVYWDESERAEVQAFRREVLEVLARVEAQAEVTFVDSDGWYSEL